MNINKWMKKYAPPGIDIAAEKGFYMGGMIGAGFWSISFIIQYMNQRSALFEYHNGMYRLIEGAQICPFEELMAYKFWPFYFVMICTLLVIVYHYIYHYQGSHMMYLMRRLPDKWELHRRCITLPLTGVVITILSMCMLWMIYYGIYIFCTPHQCLPL